MSEEFSLIQRIEYSDGVLEYWVVVRTWIYGIPARTEQSIQYNEELESCRCKLKRSVATKFSSPLITSMRLVNINKMTYLSCLILRNVENKWKSDKRVITDIRSLDSRKCNFQVTIWRSSFKPVFLIQLSSFNKLIHVKTKNFQLTITKTLLVSQTDLARIVDLSTYSCILI